MSVSALPARRGPSEATVRVLTLNLWGRSGAWEQRRAVLVDGLRALEPDLVAFQASIARDDYDQVADLLGADYAVLRQTNRAGGESGSAIASRWPLDDSRELNMHLTPRTGDFHCGTLLASIQLPAPFGPLLFVNHVPSYELDYERERELQAVAAAQAIEALVGERPMHVVLAGDFTAAPDTANVRFWRGRQSLDGMSVHYRDAWAAVHGDEAGHTFTPRNPLVPSREHPLWVDGEPGLELGRRIDYIMVRCGHHGPSLDVLRCELVFDAPVDGVWASDHCGVVADLSVPAQPEETS